MTKLGRLVKALKLIGISAMLTLSGVAFGQDETANPNPSGEEREFHAMADVPAVVLSVARQNAPSVVFTAAESYWEDDERVYRLSGRLYRDVWQVYVTEQGRFLYSESDLQDD